MNELKRYTKLKSIFDESTEIANKSQGAIEEVLKQLKDEFNCDGIEAAKKLTIRLKKKIKTKRKIIDEALEKLEQDYEEYEIDEFE